MRKTVATLLTVGAFLSYALGQRVMGHTTASTATTLGQTDQANSSPASVPSPPSASNATYKDGTYTGAPSADQWGQVQVQVTVSGGRITNVQFLTYPNERRRSVAINSEVIPILQSEAVQAQSAQVDVISGATLTSESFQQSLESALAQATA